MSALLRTRIESTAPHRPWCGMQKEHTIVRPLASALRMPFIQLNPPALVCWLQIDIDKPKAPHFWEDANLPPPTYISINRQNEHAQYGYALATPVCKSAEARLAPLRYLAAIEHAYNKKLNADVAFNGPKGKNPLHEKWLLWQPVNDAVYELNELAEYVDLPSPAEMACRKVNEDYAGLGRNCKLFEQLRKVSYSEVRKFWRPGGFEPFFAHLLEIALALNGAFSVPLWFPEVRGVAHSISKWTWNNFTPGEFSQIQAARGRRVGAAKREELLPEVRRLAMQGESNRAIARTLGLSDKTVAAWLLQIPVQNS